MARWARPWPRAASRRTRLRGRARLQGLDGGVDAAAVVRCPADGAARRLGAAGTVEEHWVALASREGRRETCVDGSGWWGMEKVAAVVAL